MQYQQTKLSSIFIDKGLAEKEYSNLIPNSCKNKNKAKTWINVTKDMKELCRKLKAIDKNTQEETLKIQKKVPCLWMEKPVLKYPYSLKL